MLKMQCNGICKTGHRCKITLHNLKDGMCHFHLKHECPICLDDIKKNQESKTVCNHKFHKECLNTWLNTHNTCPLCRSIIANKKVKRFQINMYTQFDVLSNIIELDASHIMDDDLINYILIDSLYSCDNFYEIVKKKDTFSMELIELLEY